MQELPEGRIVRFGEKEFNFSAANTGLELMKGLGGVASLEPYDGMLFDFGGPFMIALWSKSLHFPIDVAFLDEEGAVLEFGFLDSEFEMPSYMNDTLMASEPSRYALEVPVGFFKANNIQLGDKLEL